MLNNLFSFPKTATAAKFNIHEPGVLYTLATQLRLFMQTPAIKDHTLVILCIGTDRSTGDSLGPLTGTKLRLFNSYPHIYGTLENPVHATNLEATLDFIRCELANPFILAVDACLGRLESVGCISFGQGPLRPGSAVNKKLPPVGDAYINGIVNVSGFMEHFVLQSTRLHLVMKMADTIAHGLSFGLRNLSSSSLPQAKEEPAPDVLYP